MKKFLFFVFLLSFSSCDNKKAQSEYQSFELDQSFDLNINKTASLDGEKLLILFKDVPEDSRCPDGVDCMWAGKVSVDLAITLNGEAKSIQLTREGKSKSLVSASVGDYKILLHGVNPYPKNGVKRNKENYVVVLEVQKS